MNTIQNIPLEKIVKNRFQPEGVRNQATVLEIAASLVQNANNGTKGLLQVPTARKNADGMYELAFGHHRFDAFDLLVNTNGDLFFSEMPLIVRDLSDIEMFELMAVENFHRRDIGAMEEANTLNSYMTNFKKTSAETAKKFEKTEEYVRGAIRLLNLPESAQKMLNEGKLNKSAARDLLVAEKLGGADLVQEIIDEIASDTPNTSPSETIEETLRMSNQTTFLATDAGWFTSKKFPVKHLPKLNTNDIHELLDWDLTGYNTDIEEVIKDLKTLIASGMEITDESFPMVTSESLTRLRILVNPPQCEKCALHAVMSGNHLCGMPQCKKAKVEAWKKKEEEDEIRKIGIPLYQKTDGPMVVLDKFIDADKKLFTAGSADLRLLPAQYVWNNFEGISQNFKVVLIGDAALKRLKKDEADGKREESQREKEARERQQREIKEQFCKRFEWEVVSLAFAPMMDGFSNLPFLKFFRTDVIDQWAEEEDLPDGVDEDTLIKDAAQRFQADGLKSLRRLNMFHIIEMTYATKYSYRDMIFEKKSLIKYAEDFQLLANEWEVALPKDFMTQAEAYQAELDAAIKALGK